MIEISLYTIFFFETVKILLITFGYKIYTKEKKRKSNKKAHSKQADDKPSDPAQK
jgi:hypothetical protein